MEASPDRRARPRFLPIFELRVRDAESGDDLGMLVDASSTGLRLASPLALELDSTRHLIFEAGSSAKVGCEAIVRWCTSSEAHPGLHVLGLEVVRFESSVGENELLRTLLEDCVRAA